MRGLLMVVCVLAQLAPPAASDASAAPAASASALAAAPSAPRAAVEAGLLSVLGLGRRPPRVDRSRVVIPSAMLDLYRSQTGQDLDTTALPLPGRLTRNANTVRSFTHKESAIDARFPHGDRFRLHFDVAGAPAEELLTAAELRLSSLPEGERHAGGGRRQRVRVSDIVRPGRRGESKPTLRLVDTRTVDGDEPVSLDVLPACERWRREPDHNHGLLVEVEVEEGEGSARNQSHVRLRRSADQGEDEWLRQRPLLVLFADDGKRPERPAGDALARRRRATAAASGRKHKRKDGRDNCRRHPLYVDFADVGWNDWIVAPPGYDAYYCQGDCPFPMADHLNSTNHAIVQTLVNSVNPGAVPKACCVPTALSSISMLYLDEENKVVLKNYQDMAVLGCGCR